MDVNIIENYFKDTNEKILTLQQKCKDLEEKYKRLEKMFFEEKKYKNESSYTKYYEYYEKIKFIRIIILFIFSKSIINDPKNLIKYYNIMKNALNYLYS
jgi:hypothetical protein